MKQSIKKRLIFPLILAGVSQLAVAQSSNVSFSHIFQVNKPDSICSPYTGLTRKHWVEAAEYLLSGAFSYIHVIDDAMKFPKQPGVSYPRTGTQIPTEKLEGLCRTLYIAMPLLKEKPDLVLNNIKVSDYYRHHLKCITDSLHPSFIRHRKANEGPSQNLVEFGALAISLSAIPEILWKPLDQETKDRLAGTMLSYAEGPTVPSNWRFFNIFILNFLKAQGYKVNEPLLTKFIEQSLADYRSDGWYIDNAYFDYYSMWAYQTYGILWCQFFGNKEYPEYARKFISNFKDMTENYPLMFDRNGQMIMWGRSIAYRFASISPFTISGFLNDTSVNYGWLRRISSATLLQFLRNESFLKENVPTLGFYGAFEPAVQSYSCRGSVYWTGKAFLGLLLPEDNVFWTAIENEGTWNTPEAHPLAVNKWNKGANVLITNYSPDGITEVRSCPNSHKFPEWENWRVSENYNKLAYNSRFLWMADGKNGEVSMNYMLKESNQPWKPLTNYMFIAFEDGIYYRSASSRNYPDCKFQLADIPLPNGILRIDKVITSSSTEIHLGNYALPNIKEDTEKQIITHKKQKAYITCNNENSLATIPLQGWERTDFIKTQGLHPESEFSTVVNTKDKLSGEKVYVTLMLWKTNGKQFSKKELFPIRDVSISGNNKEVQVYFNDGTKKKVYFK